MTKLDWLLVTSIWLVICGVGFMAGVYMAYYIDVASSKAPDVWATERAELEVKPNYGYQTDQYTPIQPAEGWQTISTIEEL